MDHVEANALLRNKAPNCSLKIVGSYVHPCLPVCARFVDLATMAKVSVLILDEKYHGWYLHCRSPYPRVSIGTASASAS